MADSGFKFQSKKTGLAAMLEKEKEESERKAKEALTAPASKAVEKPFQYADPARVPDRIRIIFDDSGSMAGTKIDDAREGCIEFMRNCVLNQTAVAVHPMNYSHEAIAVLTTDLPQLSTIVKRVDATGGTPMFETWKQAMCEKPSATRFIIFSDGQPDIQNLKDSNIQHCIANKIPVDCVFISNNEYGSEYGAELLKDIADRTGGIFLIFDRQKVNFKTAFKYLAPTLRLQLAASVDMQKSLQDGKLK